MNEKNFLEALKKVNVPVYGTRLTIGLIEEKLKEHGILKSCKLNVCAAGKVFKLCKSFSFEMVNVNHSIPDAVGLIITNCPACYNMLKYQYILEEEH